jgi:ABC-type Zn2+ transport system substrate-binding protein/surface adhesin
VSGTLILVDIDNVLNKNLFVFVGINGKFYLDTKKYNFWKKSQRSVLVETISMPGDLNMNLNHEHGHDMGMEINMDMDKHHQHERKHVHVHLHLYQMSS